MREFKFRAWDEKNKIMHYNFEFISSGHGGGDWIVFQSNGIPFDFENPNPYFYQQLKKMQWTGLTDKNGKEIYEGDILTDQDLILWCDTCKQFQVHMPYIDGECLGCSGDINWFEVVDNITNCEVIGNMYENPDYLEK